MAKHKSRTTQVNDPFRRIQDQAVRFLSPTRTGSTSLYVQLAVLKRGANVYSHRRKIAVRRESVMVFIDDHPTANWSHPCRFQFYDPKTSELHTEVLTEFPPFLETSPPKTYQAFHEPIPVERIGRV
jgi:hypothetical protein